MSRKPISPNEVDERAELLSDDDYQYQVGRINKHLTGGGRTYARDLIPESVLPKVMREYQGAGWDVELVYDSRDGDFLKFTRRS